MPLYGHELEEDIDPLTAGLKFAVSLNKDEAERGEPFIGQAALKQIAENGSRRVLVGLKVDGRRTARQGAAVTIDGNGIGSVTSGCLSPTLEQPIAMAIIESGQMEDGYSVEVAVGSKTAVATVVKLPFYKRG